MFGLNAEKKIAKEVAAVEAAVENLEAICSIEEDSVSKCATVIAATVEIQYGHSVSAKKAKELAAKYRVVN